MMQALNLNNIKTRDKSNMLGLLLDFPLQCQLAKQLYKSARILFKEHSFNKVIFLGMGGSAGGADLIKSYLYFESKIPMIVLREYDLPNYVDSSTLVFVCSYSGDTEETVSAYQQAKDKDARIIIISSGGRLKEFAIKEDINFVEIPKGMPPRCAFGFLSIIPLGLLSRLNIIKDIEPEIDKMIALLEGLRDRYLNPRIAFKENIAKQLAKRLCNRLPFIYSSSIHFDVVATRFRAQLNENAKSLASSQLFPEMNHNEIMGWQNPKRLFKHFIVLMLRDRFMHPRVKLRMDITKEILDKEGIETIELWSQGDDLLSRILSLIYICDFVSFYLAILYGVDPTPVDRITYLKNKLAKSL
ncbi:MAG: bifunctional phosphoglucose/phosphomannose isomerase [Candidatus Omnitrophica bacterium]|nr:bifunctional phosphoglucose/phosphomannose isomerase [Candidatus Omnitrophota bacterium]